MITRSATPLTLEQRIRADQLYAEYMARPKNATRAASSAIRAAVRATANRAARYGAPPSYNQRLAYRRWKKWRARKRMMAEYGDPAAPNPVGSRESRSRGLTAFQ